MDKFMKAEDVKAVLRKIGPMRSFQVTFLKNDGNFRVLFGHMDFPKANTGDFPDAVPVYEYDSQGFRSFKIDRVVSIEYN